MSVLERQTMTLRKIINDSSKFVDEVLDGIVAAHPGAYRFASADKRAVAAPATPGRVGIVTGGGVDTYRSFWATSVPG
jgi:dihydroxyacetone kinase